MAEFRFDINARNNASGEIRQLQGEVRAAIQDIISQQGALRSSTFNAFSRAGIQPQILALDEYKGKLDQIVAKIQVVGQTVGTIPDMQRLIASVTGLDGSLRSAAASAGTLRQSLAAAADSDRVLRELSSARYSVVESLDRVQNIQAKVTIDPEQANKNLRSIKAEAERSASEVREAWSRGFIPDSVYRQTEATLARIRQEAAKTGEAIRAEQAKTTQETIRQSGIQAAEILRAGSGPFRATAVSNTQTDISSVIPNFNRYQLQQTIDRVVGEQQARQGTTGLFSRLNRQGALEAQAAVVNTVQALASGMNPLHVAMMESTQLAGAFVQGGLLPLSSVLKFLVSPIGLAVAGIAALGATLVLVAHSIAQADAQFAASANRAALQGRDSRQVGVNSEAMYEQIRTSGGLGRQESRTAAVGIQGIPNISASARNNLAESFTALTRSFEGDAEKTQKAIESAFATPQSMKAFVDENRLLIGTLKEDFDAAVAAGDGFAASALAAQGLRDRLAPTIDILKAAREELGAIGRTGDLFGIEFENAVRRRTGGGGILTTPRFREGTQAPTELEARARDAADATLRTDREINGLLHQRRSIQADIANSASTSDKTRLDAARKEIDLKLSEAHAPTEQLQQSVVVQRLQNELTVLEQMALKEPALRVQVVEKRKQLADIAADYEQGALKRVENASRIVTANQLADAQKIADERRRITREALDERLFQSQYRSAQTPTDPGRQLLETQKQLREIEKDITGEHKERQPLLMQELQLQKQIRDQVRDTAQAGLSQREALAQARDDLVAVVGLKRQEAALVAANPDATPGDRIRAQTAIMQAQIAAQQAAIQNARTATDSANQFANSRLETARSMLGLEVAQYNRTSESAIQADMRLTSAVMAQNQARLASTLNIQGLTLAQKAQINDQLAALYEQDAQKQIQLQQQLTQEIRQENERRTQYFKNFFQSVEQGSADLLIAGVTKSQTRTEALRSFARSITSSFIGEMSKMGSQFAGKGLANALGIKIDPSGDTSISAVLSKGLGEALGISKPEPKLDQAAINEKLKQAGEAHKTAAELLMQAAKDLSKAAAEGPFNAGRGPKPGEESVRQTAFPSVRDPSVARASAPEAGVAGAESLSNLQPSTIPVKRISGLDSGFSTQLQSMIADASDKGITIGLGSGFRSVERQAELFQDAVAKYGSEAAARKYVAPPGSSMHNFGKADDLVDSSGRAIRKGSVEDQYLGENAGRFGLTRPMSYEPWHVEPVGARSGQPLKVDPSTIAQGVAQGQQSDIQATQKSVQASLDETSKVSDNSEQTTENTSSIRELISALKQPAFLSPNKTSDGKELGSWSPISESKGDKPSGGASASSSLSLLTQGLGIAASAASLFGRQLSPAARAILGVVGILGQLSGFVKNAGSIFDIFGTTTKAAGTASSLLSTANTANTLSTTLNTTATYANSTAQTASAGGSALGGIGSALKLIPIIGGLFEQGGIVASAAGGMLVGGGALAGGGQISILHPREMVLPANISSGLQNMISQGGSSNNSGGNTLNYNANVNGYHPYGSKSSFESMLRQHGGTMMKFIEGAARNGWRG